MCWWWGEQGWTHAVILLTWARYAGRPVKFAQVQWPVSAATGPTVLLSPPSYFMHTRTYTITYNMHTCNIQTYKAYNSNHAWYVFAFNSLLEKGIQKENNPQGRIPSLSHTNYMIGCYLRLRWLWWSCEDALVHFDHSLGMPSLGYFHCESSVCLPEFSEESYL